MLRLVVIGCGICGAILAGKFGIWKLKEHTAKAASGSDGSPMSIISKGLLCVQDHIGPWSPPEVLLGLAAMAKITEKDPLNTPGRPIDLANNSEFLMKAQHWRALAEAIYVSDLASFSLFSHLPESSIVAAKWNSDQDSLRPAYVLAVDPAFGSLVLSIRGTSHVVDILVSAGASPVEFEGGYAHSGFARATDSLLKEILPHIQRVFEQDSLNKLVIVGHSMGAAIGCMCGLKLKNEYEGLECWGYSVPASVSIDLARACASFATCFVCVHDVVPRFSVASVEDLRKRICSFDWDRANEIAKDDEDWQKISKAVEVMQRYQRTQDAVGRNVESFQNRVCSAVSRDEHGDDHGCSDGESELPSLYPPGRLLVLSSDPPGCGKVPAQRSGVAQQRNYGAFPSYEEAKNVKWVMHEASQEDFSQIVLSPWSVSDHVLGNLCEGINFFQAHSSPVHLG